jgi:ferrous iron transport protein B
MDQPAISVEVEQATQKNEERLFVPPRIHTVALAGPPNSGKSTLFNRLTNLRQKIANYPGVTVEYRIGKLSKAEGISLVDLPGIRGAAASSEDEEVAWKVLRGRLPGVSKPDAILLILDGTNLHAQLPLASAVLALELRTLVLVNMADTLRDRGGSLDVQALQESLGVPAALVSAIRGTGLEAIEKFLGGSRTTETPSLLPILQNAGQRRSWSKDIAARAKYRVPKESLWTKRLDSFFLHPLFGPLFLLIATVLVFQGVFVVGQFMSNAIDAGLRFVGEAIRPEITNPILQSLVLDGLWKGMGSVLVFLPPILILFLFMGLMEDSGYLARAAVISDRTMAKIGLNGKSFIPLLAGYGCAVPAIMATRILGNKRDRLATIFVIPFMTCSARLPVYTLLIAAFIPANPILGGLVGLRACVLLSLYVLGFFAAVTTAKLLNSTILERSKIPFVLELPEYRLPSARPLVMLLLERARIFLTQVGTVVLGVSFVIWLFTHLPLHAGRMSGLDESFLARAGQWVEPALRPLGFNWKIGVGLLSSFVAREVMVGTLGTIYGAEAGSHSTVLAAQLQRDLTFPGAMALLVFFALAMQCTSTFATVKRETSSWKWPILQLLYMGGLAYGAAWLANFGVSQLLRS